MTTTISVAAVARNSSSNKDNSNKEATRKDNSNKDKNKK